MLERLCVFLVTCDFLERLCDFFWEVVWFFRDVVWFVWWDWVMYICWLYVVVVMIVFVMVKVMMVVLMVKWVMDNWMLQNLWAKSVTHTYIWIVDSQISHHIVQAYEVPLSHELRDRWMDRWMDRWSFYWLTLLQSW